MKVSSATPTDIITDMTVCAITGAKIPASRAGRRHKPNGSLVYLVGVVIGAGQVVPF